jgi:hypothetical protein
MQQEATSLHPAATPVGPLDLGMLALNVDILFLLVSVRFGGDNTLQKGATSMIDTTKQASLVFALVSAICILVGTNAMAEQPTRFTFTSWNATCDGGKSRHARIVAPCAVSARSVS